MTTLSVVIPATDAPPTLERALAAVRRARAAPEEVIVVERPPKIGPAAARNRGAMDASGDVLVFVDADVEVHEDAFERIRDAFDRDGALAAVFGSYDDAPAVDGLVSDFRNLLHHHVHNQGAGAATTFWAGLGAIRNDVFRNVGGFDDARFPKPSVEDIDLGMRLYAQGAPLRLDPAIQGKHLKRWTLGSMVRTDLLQRGAPWFQLVLESGSSSRALNLGWSHRVGTAASLVLLVAAARGNTRIAGVTCALLLAADRRFYALLLRRGGPKLVAAGFPLYLVHRLTAVAAVPIAVGNVALRRP